MSTCKTILLKTFLDEIKNYGNLNEKYQIKWKMKS